MSFEFGLKNISRKWAQSLSYIVTIAIITAISVFFIYLGNGLGLVFFESIPRFNITTVELFSQYFKFIIIASMIIAVVWIVVVNHSLIHHKTHDIAIMKAVGAIQKKLRSYFFAVIVVIDIIGIIIGLITGFLLYLFFFFLLSAFGFDIIVYVDMILVPILVGGIAIAVFFVNGFELWKISTKNYAQIALGDIPKNIEIQIRKLKPKRITNLSLKLAFRNLTRKRKSFYRILLTTGITFSIIVTLITSAVIISTTSIQSISGAQGGEAIIIGHYDVVNHYLERYEEFSNPFLQFTNNQNLTKSEYLMNETEIETVFTSSLFPQVNYWDKRLFVYEFAQELKGYIYSIVGGEETYRVIGSNRSADIPVVGLEFKEYTTNWQIIGSIDPSPDSALVGDTLAFELFEVATYQRIRLQNVTTNEYNIAGVFLDSFCSGSAAYVHLNSLQQDFNLEDKINIMIVGISPNVNKEVLINSLQTALKNNFGNDFVAEDITPIFKNNVKSLFPFVIVSGIVILIEFIVIIASLYLYQSGNFQERAYDYAIIKGVGGTATLIKNQIFYEDLAILCIASSISIGINLIFNSLLLYRDAILPPIWLIFLLWFVISILIITVVRISIFYLYKRLKKQQLEVLKDFSRSK